jgi:eukaryotic-like serine/threonine-protein kinase
MPCQPLESVKTHAAASPSAESSYKYWAFISYSHRDKEWAQWLHTALETYRIPARLAQRSAASDAWPSRDRIYPVFLDREELSGGFDLGERIRTALEQSCFLIVICSPHAVASHHVQQEIDAFESLGREHRVLCLIIDGEPGASGMPASGLQECLPAPVRTRRTPEGELVPCEPIAADARKAKDGKTNAKLKILAEMLGVPFAELRQRDEHRRLRRRL